GSGPAGTRVSSGGTGPGSCYWGSGSWGHGFIEVLEIGVQAAEGFVAGIKVTIPNLFIGSGQKAKRSFLRRARELPEIFPIGSPGAALYEPPPAKRTQRPEIKVTNGLPV